MRFFAATLVVAFLAVAGGAFHQSWPDWWWRFREPPPALVFKSKVRPFLERNCYECHDTGTRKGNFALDRLAPPVPQSENREAWERVIQHVSGNIMPPADGPKPGQKSRAEFLSWLDRTLHPVDPRHPDPGRVVIRRLSREEYKNTVQDLFGVAFNPAEGFPDDDSGYGFDHIGSVLGVSPLLFERYLSAARQVASVVVPDPAPPPQRFSLPSSGWTGADVNDAEVALYSNKTARCRFDPPAAGRYRIDLDVYEDRLGDEPARFALRIDGRTLRELAAKAGRRKPLRHSVEVDLPAGPVELQIAFLNDAYEPATATAKAKDRNFHLAEAGIEGPLAVPGRARPEGPLPAWISPPRTGESRSGWYARNLAPVVRKAYRRAPKPSELDRLAFLAERSEAAGDSAAASFQVALQAMLASPSFLFIGEPVPASSSARVTPLSDHALASRLSYFLWNGPPDERLLDLADRGELRAGLARETARLLADPRSRRFVDNFAGQWLEVRNLPLRTPDPGLYPEWSAALAASMKEETLRFFADFLVNDRPLSGLLTADYTFVDSRLAAFYKLPAPADGVSGFERVPLPPDRRAGIFGQAGILAVTSYPNRTSPVLRGKFVLEKILGTPTPPPPPNIPSLAEHSADGRPSTLRGRLEQHRANPNCSACHSLIDPIGFALEHYDSLGRRRETEGGQPIDSAGRLATGESVDSPVTLSAVLATGRADDFYRNFARTLLVYALGRGLDYYDRPTVDRIVQAAAARGHTLPAYIDAVVSSIAFQYQRTDTPRATVPDGPFAFVPAP